MAVTRGPTHSVASTNVADLLERVLDKGVVIAGDIKVSLLDIELLTIQIRLVVCSVDKAKEMGMDWWANNPVFAPMKPKDDEPAPLAASMPAPLSSPVPAAAPLRAAETKPAGDDALRVLTDRIADLERELAQTRTPEPAQRPVEQPAQPPAPDPASSPTPNVARDAALEPGSEAESASAPAKEPAPAEGSEPEPESEPVPSSAPRAVFASEPIEPAGPRDEPSVHRYRPVGLEGGREVG